MKTALEIYLWALAEGLVVSADLPIELIEQGYDLSSLSLTDDERDALDQDYD